jgi:hypothetical protein
LTNIFKVGPIVIRVLVDEEATLKDGVDVTLGRNNMPSCVTPRYLPDPTEYVVVDHFFLPG